MAEIDLSCSSHAVCGDEPAKRRCRREVQVRQRLRVWSFIDSAVLMSIPPNIYLCCFRQLFIKQQPTYHIKQNVFKSFIQQYSNIIVHNGKLNPITRPL